MTEGSPHDRSGEKDQVKPFHAKDVASGQEAADAVAAVIKHAAERDEAARRKAPAKTQPKWMLPLGLNLGLLAVYLLIAPPSWVIVNPIAPPPDEQRVGNLRTGMFVYGTRIESYQRTNGRLPATLAEAGIGVDGLEYIPRPDGTYVLIASVGEQEVRFDSAQGRLADFDPNVSQKLGG